MHMTGGDALALQLAREDLTTIFGVPGVQLDLALDGLAKIADQVTFVATRHEQAASYMADGYARSTGRIGTCMVVPGPGLLNAAAGLATAYACSSPVLCIVGQIASPLIGQGRGMLHEIPHQTAVLAGLTKWSTLVRRAEDIPTAVHEAVGQLRTGRPRPVGLEIPPDVLESSAEIELLAPWGPGDDAVGATPVDATLVERAAELLRGAARPVVLVGSGVVAAGASGALVSVAERLGSPVVMTMNGRGAISDRHPLALTALGGREILPQADVVLAVGTRFLTPLGRPVGLAPDARSILVNADPDDLAPPRAPDVALAADALVALRALDAALAGRRECWAPLDEVRARCDAQIAEIEPQRSWLMALRAAIPDDGILVNELTQVGYLGEIGYPVYEPRSYLTPGYQGTLGYGFATALGAKVANPDKVVVSINGDGGFGWTLAELATARKYGIGVVTVVFDDSAFGNVRRIQRQRFGREIGVELDNPDFVALAESFGVRARRVHTPDELRGAVTEVAGADGPTLIEVPVGEMPSPWHLIRDHLAKR